jgi:hypothetical protein
VVVAVSEPPQPVLVSPWQQVVAGARMGKDALHPSIGSPHRGRGIHFNRPPLGRMDRPPIDNLPGGVGSGELALWSAFKRPLPAATTGIALRVGPGVGPIDGLAMS